MDSLKVRDVDRNAWLDLRPYIDNAAYTVNEHASVLRTYRMFRTLGLRHLCVINKHNNLLGIITRADLASIHNEEPRSKKREGREGDPNSNLNSNLLALLTIITTTLTLIGMGGGNSSKGNRSHSIDISNLRREVY